MVHMRVVCLRGRESQFNDAAAMTAARGVPFMRWIIDQLRVTQSLKRICLCASLAVKAYALVCLRVLASGHIDLCVFRPPKLYIDILIKRLCCLKPFAPGGVLVTHTHAAAPTLTGTASMAIDNCVIFFWGNNYWQPALFLIILCHCLIRQRQSAGTKRTCHTPIQWDVNASSRT